MSDDGAVYVAESGAGGDDCFAGPEMIYEGDEFCAGDSAQITRISDGEVEPALTGLPSITWAGDAYGTQDITSTRKVSCSSLSERLEPTMNWARLVRFFAWTTTMN